MNHTPNLQLRRLLDEAQWTMERLAGAVNSLAQHEGTSLHYDRTSVAHWLKGARPRDPAPRLIAAALSNRLARALTLTDIGLAPPTPPSTRTGLIADFLAACAGPATGAPRTSVVTGRASSGATAASMPTPHNATAAFYVNLHYRFGGHGSNALTTYITDEAPQHNPTASLADYAKLAYTLGLLVDDRAEPERADTLWEHSTHLARQAGHHDLQAIALRARAALAHRRGHNITALALATRAQHAADSHTTKAYTLILRATVLAKLHDTTSAQQALVQAESHYQPPAASDDPFTIYPEAGFLFQQAQVLAACGHRREAIAALGRSLQLRPPTELRNQALTHAALAILLLPDSATAAAAHIESLCTLHPGVQSNAVHLATQRLSRRLEEAPPTQRNTQLSRRVDRLAVART